VRITPKFLIMTLITLILVVGEVEYGILKGWTPLVLCLGGAVAAELLLSWFVLGRPGPVASAYVSGTSLTLLLKPEPGLLWPFLVGAGLSIGSKYVLRYKGRHLWNPTNFGIAALLLVAPGKVAALSHEFGNDITTNLVIWAVGLLIASRAKILHVTLTYVPAFLLFAWLRTFVNGQSFVTEVTPLTGPMYQLFVFFMVTDPPTTVATKRGRMLVVFLVAAFESLIRTGNDLGWAWARPFAPAPPIFALAIIGPIALATRLAVLGPIPRPGAKPDGAAQDSAPSRGAVPVT
jgi:Na+-transporting NADH:ubiquinone oxidoreductase subunit NqrB